MSDDKPQRKIRLTPYTIDLTDQQVNDIVGVGVEEVMGFKLCRFFNKFDVDEGTNKVSIRVCGGSMDIPCECEISDMRQAEAKESMEVPLLLDDTFKEDEF